MVKKIILLIGIVILFSSFASAIIDITLDVKDSFGIGEDVKFSYTIISSSDGNVTYLPIVNCPNAPVPLLDMKTLELKANVLLEEEYIYYSNLGDEVESQTCTAYIEILEPIEKSVEETFKINTNPSFEFEIVLDKKIFVQGENVEIISSSNEGGLTIIATLIFPDGEIKSVNLPYSFKPEQIGTYTLEVTASKNGYKTVTTSTQFGVIEEEVDIEYIETPLGNEGKSFEDEKKFEINSKYVIYIVIGFIFIFGIIVLVIFLVNRSKNKTPLNFTSYKPSTQS